MDKEAWKEMVTHPSILAWRIPWTKKPGRKWQPSPVFLPGEAHGQKSLAGFSPWGGKELDTTELLTFTHLS